jgi:hypothetical protein
MKFLQDFVTEDSSSVAEQLQQSAALFNQKLNYSIFGRHRSSLRDIPKSIVTGNQNSLMALYLLQEQIYNITQQNLPLLDGAHEIILGISWNNIEDAECYAKKRHMNNTSYKWIDRYPLDTTDDFIHSIIHRIEGNNIGEGSYSGYQNAKYWFSGGPKQHTVIPTHDHPVYQSLCEIYLQIRNATTEKEDDIIAILPSSFVHDDIVEYEIIAGGGATRIVKVQPNSWDGIGVINAWQCISEVTSSTSKNKVLHLLMKLHQVELQLWILYEQANRTLSKQQLIDSLLQ